MNIFVLHDDPYVAGAMLDDKRLGKMLIESGQLLATAFREHGVSDEQLLAEGVVTSKGTPWKATHRNHPCALWARETRANAMWLYVHAMGIADEFRRRRGKDHGCWEAVRRMAGLLFHIPKGPLTPFALAMPDVFKSDNAVTSYRDYYLSKDNLVWNNGAHPAWSEVVE